MIVSKWKSHDDFGLSLGYRAYDLMFAKGFKTTFLNLCLVLLQVAERHQLWTRLTPI